MGHITSSDVIRLNHSTRISVSVKFWYLPCASIVHKWLSKGLSDSGAPKTFQQACASFGIVFGFRVAFVFYYLHCVIVFLEGLHVLLSSDGSDCQFICAASTGVLEKNKLAEILLAEKLGPNSLAACY